MTCRLKSLAALAALMLTPVVSGCSGPTDHPGRGAAVAASPTVAKLLTDADAMMRNGRLADAAGALDSARSLAPENPDLWLAIARLRLRGGEHLTALEAADRALALGPDHGPSLLLRALMMRDAHGAADALPWFEAAIEADGENPDIWAEYAATLGDNGQARAMLAAVRRLGEISPNDPRVPFLQAVLAARGGEDALARSLLARSGMASRSVPAALLLDAVISLREGNTDSAALTLEGLAARQPANVRLRELLVHALLAGGHADEVVRRFGADATAPEASPYLTMMVARAQERLGDRKAAASLLVRAYAARRNGPSVLAAREGLPTSTAEVRRDLLAGSGAGARDKAAALRAQFPASADVASLAGDALLGSGDPKAALAAYSLASEARRPWPLARKAIWALDRSGNHNAANLLLARFVAGETDNATALFALAQRLAERGDWAHAAPILDHAVTLGAGHDPALLGLRMRAARELDNPDDAQRFAALMAELRPRSLAAR